MLRLRTRRQRPGAHCVAKSSSSLALPIVVCRAFFGLAPARSVTPEIIFYSKIAQPVFRRQRILIAAKLAGRNRTSIMGWKNDGLKDRLGIGRNSARHIIHGRAGAGLSLPAG